MAEAYASLGLVLHRLGRLAEAADAYRRALAINPRNIDIRNNLSVALKDLGRWDEAEAESLQALDLAPDDARLHYNHGVLMAGRNRLDEAEASYRRAVALNPDYAEAHNNLGFVLQERSELDEAVEAYRRAIALKPDYAQAHNNLGVVLQDQGLLDEAEAAYRRALDLKPDYAEAFRNLARLRPLDGASPESAVVFEKLRQQVEAIDTFDAEGRCQLLFAMSEALDARGELDDAFEHMRQANALRRASLSFDIDRAERRLAAIAETFSAEVLERAPGAGAQSERPIFIVGMPRSGSTLVEQILGAHPEVHGAGELPNLGLLLERFRARDHSGALAWARDLSPGDRLSLGQAYLDSLPPDEPGRGRLTDKSLDNFEAIGLIRLCLPNATIVHCQRDPRDVCLSCFGIRFNGAQDYAYDLSELGRYWRAYDRLMAHWRRVLPPGRMLEVRYEALVEDLEAVARRLVADCGLAWDDACLRFYDSKRVVRTASSAQVRRPIYAGSVGRWRGYAHHLGPLFEALGEPWTAT